MAFDQKRPWNIRKAEKAEWSIISEISAEVSASDPISDYINGIGSRYMDVGDTYVLEQGNIIGFLKLQWLPDSSIYISGLRVRPDSRRRGAGTELVKGSLEQGRLKKSKAASALIEPYNEASISLFSGAGFRIVDQLYFYQGKINLDGFSPYAQWPESFIDIGFRYVRPYDGIPAKLMKNGMLLASASFENIWSEEPAFTVLSDGRFNFEPGNNRVTIPKKYRPDSLDNLVPLEGFESAFVMEASLA